MATREGRRAWRLTLLALAALVLTGCGVLPYTGPPEDNEYPLNNHGSP